jgi:aldehyde:ferredoxin oxidoreductase
MIRRISRREGFGDLLALGTKRAADRIGGGAYRYAMNAKGMELPGYEPRAAKAHGLGNAVSNIGGSHMYGYCRQEISGRPEPIDPLRDDGKGDITASNQIKKAMEEILILCNFADTNISEELICNLLTAGTGSDELGEPGYLRLVGERIVCLERCFNVREGFRRSDDYLPERFLREPLPKAGPATGEYYRSYDTLLDEYYNALGYNDEGIPTGETLIRLGIEGIVRDL